MSIDLYDYSLVTIFVAGLAAIWIAIEIGYRLGDRTAGRGGSNVTTLESAVLGLLALMIGFTFAMSLTRFETRRDAVLNEANAIGTTALRARLLPEPHRGEVLKLLRDYVEVRLDITRRMGVSRSDIIATVEQANRLQEALWQHAMAMAAKDPGMVPTGLFIQSLNETIDDQAKRVAVLQNRVPNAVMLALFAVAIIAGAFAGYASGLDERRSRIPVYVMGPLVAGVILLIMDLDRPGSGFIDISQQPMIDTAASIRTFVD
jgi:hypothetical protein